MQDKSKKNRGIEEFLWLSIAVYFLAIFVFSRQILNIKIFLYLMLGIEFILLGTYFLIKKHVINWDIANLAKKSSVKLSLKKQIFIITVIALLPKLILILTNQIPQISDYQYYYNNAVKFINESPFQPDDYTIAIAPNILSFITILSVVFRVFGTSVLVGLIFNLVLITGSTILIFLCARKIMDEGYAFLCGISFALSPSVFLYSLYLAIEPIAGFSFLGGFLLFLKAYELERSFKQLALYFLSGLVVGISNEIRPNALALLVAMIGFVLFLSKIDVRRRLQTISFILIGFFIFSFVFGLYQKAIFKTDMGITYGWALYEGLDINSFGSWSEESSEVMKKVLEEYSPNEVQKVLLDKALDRAFSYNAKDWFRLIMGKGATYWCSNDYPLLGLITKESFLTEMSTRGESLKKILLNEIALHVPYYIAIAMFINLAIVSYFRKKKSKKKEPATIMAITIIIIIISHSFVTSIPRYHYSVMPFVLLSAFYLLDKTKNPTINHKTRADDLSLETKDNKTR